MAAPQIGISKRIIAINMGKGTFPVINPRIIERSVGKFRMWDDCMSFPDLLIRLERHTAIKIEYQNENGEMRTWGNMSQAESELLQHEIDHLDGVLAIDLAWDKDSIVYRDEYEKARNYFDSLVDYVIKPSI